jgi:hypothetical protein
MMNYEMMNDGMMNERAETAAPHKMFIVSQRSGHKAVIKRS